VRQGSLAVARPLDLSGRNAWLARPLFHPLVAHREHFSQRCPALPQHFVQDHSHRGLCNRESLSHRDFYSRPLPAALDFLPPPPPPGPTPTPARRLHRPRVVSFARDYFFSSFLFSLLFSSSPPPHFFYLSHKQRSKLRATLRCAHRVIYGWSCSPSGLSINYGQFSSLAFIYAVSNVCACARCIAVV